MTERCPKISIIVPVFNCERTIHDCLESLLNLDYPDYEIIIIDDGSTDNTTKICQSHKRVNVIQIPNGGPSRARNIGVKKAKGEIVAFTDGDCIVHRQWLKELQKGFSSDKIAGVGGNQISPPNETAFGKSVQETFAILGFATSYMKPYTTLTETRHNPSCNSAYQKHIFESIGGFNESLWPGEDVDLDYRLIQNGHTLIRNPEAIVKHYRPQSLSGLCSMMQRYGGATYLLLKKYGFFRLLHYIPFLLPFVLCSIIIASIYKPSLLLFSPLVLLALLLFFLGRKGFSKKSVTILFLSLVILVNWHLGFYKQPFKTDP